MSKSDIAIITAGIAVGLALSYLAALLGHPNSVWLWHDILRVL